MKAVVFLVQAAVLTACGLASLLLSFGIVHLWGDKGLLYAAGAILCGWLAVKLAKRALRTGQRELDAAGAADDVTCNDGCHTWIPDGDR